VLLAAGPPAVGWDVTVAVLVAAVLHATWNAVAHGIRDQLAGFSLIGLAYAGCSALVLPFVAVPAGASWPFLIASAALHVVYILLLLASYRLGDFGQVYPLARGSSPLLVAAVSVTVVGDRLSAVQLVGVAVVSAGLASLTLVGGRPRAGERGAIVAAVATGVAIAAYTVLDGLGVRRSGSVGGYTAWLFLLQGPVVPLIAAGIRGRQLAGQLRRYAGAGLLAGLLSLAAYGLVLWAQTRGALAAVAALRESSVIVGAAIGAVVFHERFGRARVLATVLVAGGIVLLNLR
jgi:drug/metabolite transporter (DMT)-like permease